jgi:hypothetical protein
VPLSPRFSSQPALGGSPTDLHPGEEPSEGVLNMRKIIYALMSLAAFAMAVGAGWRPAN